jgi:pimeloyl-ACP methyl ester carboxylesterase
MIRIFLHGLESSSQGTKATYLKDVFPDMLIPDFRGGLQERMSELAEILCNLDNIIITGSSFGGLMGTIYAMHNSKAVSRLLLLAPALNFPEFSSYELKKTAVPTRLIIGSNDTVTPASDVLPLARRIFTRLQYEEVDDDHMLANSFRKYDWRKLLAE